MLISIYLEVKLIDFGVAKSLSGTIARSCVGTTEIMAPELVSAKLLGSAGRRKGSDWGWRHFFKCPKKIIGFLMGFEWENS